eukprot:gene5869-7068_t
MSEELSSKIAAALVRTELADDRGYLQQDPRNTMWRELIAGQVPEVAKLPLEDDLSPISEELNMAYASHEIVAEFMEETLAWMAGEREIGQSTGGVAKS